MDKKNILVIDDEESVRELIPGLLSPEIYNVVAVNDGKSGLELLQNQIFHAALVDIKMPGKDGLEILKLIKERKPDMEVIIMTGYATMDEAIQALKHDAADFIQKPFDNEEVVLSIKNAVKRYDLKVENRRLIKELGEEKDRLLKMNEKLKELDSMKSSFVSTVSHELRTPLTVILSTINNILDGILGQVPDYHAKWLKMIKNNAERLQSLIEDILDISKLESGKVDMRKEKVNMTALAKKVVSDLAPLAQKNSVSLNISALEEIPAIDANNSRIEQVLTNLTSNAIKFTPPGGTIDVTVTRKANFVYVEVKDSGIGIAKENLERIFDRFRQAAQYQDANEQRSKGIGLGLAIAKEIIAQHNGRIWAESDSTNGSRFIFTLPLSLFPSGKKVRVMAVDDDEELQELYKLALERLGCEVDVMPSGEAAIEKIRKSNLAYDVIFCDLNLPGRNGVDTLLAIKEIDPGIQSAIVTAFPDSKLLSAAMKSGPIMIVPKPLDGSKIYEVTKKLLAHRSVAND